MFFNFSLFFLSPLIRSVVPPTSLSSPCRPALYCNITLLYCSAPCHVASWQCLLLLCLHNYPEFAAKRRGAWVACPCIPSTGGGCRPRRLPVSPATALRAGLHAMSDVLLRVSLASRHAVPLPPEVLEGWSAQLCVAILL